MFMYHGKDAWLKTLFQQANSYVGYPLDRIDPCQTASKWVATSEVYSRLKTDTFSGKRILAGYRLAIIIIIIISEQCQTFIYYHAFCLLDTKTMAILCEYACSFKPAPRFFKNKHLMCWLIILSTDVDKTVWIRRSAGPGLGPICLQWYKSC